MFVIAVCLVKWRSGGSGTQVAGTYNGWSFNSPSLRRRGLSLSSRRDWLFLWSPSPCAWVYDRRSGGGYRDYRSRYERPLRRGGGLSRLVVGDRDCGRHLVLLSMN